MFLDYQELQFFRVFLVYLMKKRPIFTALKQMILDEIRQSNGIRPQKINFFHDFCKLSSSQRASLLDIAFKIYLYLLRETLKISLLRTHLPPFI